VEKEMESFMADEFFSFLNLYERISDWSVLEGVNDRRCNKQHGCGKERGLMKK
jgi:hypothetical protein